MAASLSIAERSADLIAVDGVRWRGVLRPVYRACSSGTPPLPAVSGFSAHLASREGRAVLLDSRYDEKRLVGDHVAVDCAHIDLWDICLLIGLGAGFLIGGFVVDLFAHRQSWWRWGYAPLVAGIPGVILCVWVEMNPSVIHLLVAAVLFPFVVLIPMGLAAIGVGIRRRGREDVERVGSGESPS